VIDVTGQSEIWRAANEREQRESTGFRVYRDIGTSGGHPPFSRRMAEEKSEASGLAPKVDFRLA
jgi:hypothetical protein